MPTQRLSMRRIREVLRLRQVQGLTERVIARMIGVSNGVVHGYLRRARLAGLTWPLPEDMDDEALELLLFPAPKAATQSPRRPAPDWSYVEKELRRRSVRFGRPPALSAEQIALARQLIEDGQKPRAVAQVLKVHPATLYRAIERNSVDT